MDTLIETDRRGDGGRHADIHPGRPSMPSVQGRSVSVIDYNRKLFRIQFGPRVSAQPNNYSVQTVRAFIATLTLRLPT